MKNKKKSNKTSFQLKAWHAIVITALLALASVTRNSTSDFEEAHSEWVVWEHNKGTSSAKIEVTDERIYVWIENGTKVFSVLSYQEAPYRTAIYGGHLSTSFSKNPADVTLGFSLTRHLDSDDGNGLHRLDPANPDVWFPSYGNALQFIDALMYSMHRLRLSHKEIHTDLDAFDHKKVSHQIIFAATHIFTTFETIEDLR